MEVPSLLVFGPQTTPPSESILAQLRESLLQDRRLQPLRFALEALPSLWQRLVAADPDLDRIPGQVLLENFPRWLAGGDLLPSQSQAQNANIILTPLTVLLHAVQYISYLDSKRSNFNHRELLQHVEPLGGVQGFCTGMLSALTIASAKDETAIAEATTIALRLAAGIGAYVDLDGLFGSHVTEPGCLAVRWNSEHGKEVLTECLLEYSEAYISAITEQNCATVTACKSNLETLLNDLSARGFTTKKISLAGRFHRSNNQKAVENLTALCSEHPDLQLPRAESLIAPVRSNLNAAPTTHGSLHEQAIKSILVDRCNWQNTVSAAARQLSSANQPIIVQVGLVDCVPASVARDSGSSIVRLRNSPLSMTNPAGTARPSAISSDSITSSHKAISPDSVAMVGMACRFPGASNLQDFWEVISEGRSMARQMPEERFSITGLRRSPEDKLKFWGNFIDDVDAFDHRFFKKSAREASSMDPQQRILLQVAYEAIESSGYYGEFDHSQPSDIGCYIGVCSSDYNDNVASHPPNAYSSLGTLRAFLSGKVSHFFGWTGPSITYDTACSSSAVAIHAACKAIQTGECSRAIAGGVSLYTSPYFYQNLAAASFLSPTGPTKPFDARGDGYCRGEGIGLVVLKRLSQALADGDHVMGVIAASAVNQNENSTSITVPHSPSQISLYQKVVSEAGVDAHDVSFVEAHGTGTPVGDPIEFESIRKVFGGYNRASDLQIASVKGNIGHLEGASGIAALIKIGLMMEKEVIPIQANYRRLNPKIAPLEQDKISIPLSTQPWHESFKVACINNYGAAGSNAALLVRQSPKAPKSIVGVDHQHALLPKYPFYISANSALSLQGYCRALSAYISKLAGSDSEQGLLQNLTFNLSRKQNRSLPLVLTSSVSSLADLRQQLELGSTTLKPVQPPKARPVILAFGGQVSTFIGLDRGILQSSDIFRHHLEECDRILSTLGLTSMFPEIFQTEPVEDVVKLHSMLFATQYACAKSWIDSGLSVDAVIGHSFGQLTGLCVSGVLSLRDTIKLVTSRARLMETSWGGERGSMISVQGDISVVNNLLTSINIDPKPEIACYNADDSYVLAGSTAAVDMIEEILKAPSPPFRSLKHKRLNVTHGFHSRFTEEILPGLMDTAQDLTFNKPKLHLETCSDVCWDSYRAESIIEHTRTPVYFAKAVKRLAARFGSATWIEAGSNSSIIGMVRRAVSASASSHVFQPMHLGTTNATSLLVDATCNLWKEGHKVQFWPFHNQQSYNYARLILPPYQFEKNRHWLDWQEAVTQVPVAEVLPIQAKPEQPVFLSLVKYLDKKQQDAEFVVDTRSEEYKFFVKGHAVLAQPLCPAPLYVEIASQSAMILGDNPDSVQTTPIVKNLQIQAPLGANETLISLLLKKVESEVNTWNFTFSTQGKGGAPQCHASGTVSLPSDIQRVDEELGRFERLVGHRKLAEISMDPHAEALQGSLVYKVFGKVVTYADYYKGVRSVFAKNCEVAGTVTLPSSGSIIPGKMLVNPLAVDNFVQVAGLHVNCLTEINEKEVYVCTRVDMIQAGPSFKQGEDQQASWGVYSNYHSIGEKEIVNDIFVFDLSTKKLCFVVLGARFTRVMISSLTRVLSRANDNPDVPLPAPSRMAPAIAVGQQPKKPTVRATSQAPKTSPVKRSTPDTSLRLKKLLSSVTEIPLDELNDDASLLDLGVDSLMITEVLSEINKGFATSISMDEFALMTDIASVVKHLNALGGIVQVEGLSDDSSDDGDDSSSSVQQNTGTVTPVTVPGTPSPSEGLSIKLGELVAEHLGTDDAMTRDVNLADQGLDSLLCMELATDIKKIFDVDVDMAQLNMDSNFGDLVDLVAAKVGSALDMNLHTAVSEKIETSRIMSEHLQISNDDNEFPARAQAAFESVRFDYDIYTKQTGFFNFWKHVYPAQARLVLAYTVEAFAKLGCDLASLESGKPLPRIIYESKHQQLVDQLYNVLRDGMLIANDGKRFVRSDHPVDRTSSAEILKQLHAKAPQHTSEHKLLDITGSKLAECLTGSADPLALLFRAKENKALLEDVYANGPMYEAVSKLLSSFLGGAFTSAGNTETINILELGGGTGGTTKHVVGFLASKNIPFTYTFTDISGSLVAAARKKFAGVKGMQFQVLDIEKEPASKFEDKYHAIISTNCIHATRNLELSAKHIRRMLVPGGFVALVEFTRNMYWFDLVFGLLEGWWLFNDGRQHVLADEWFWDSSMRKSGFEHVTWTDGTSEEARTLRIICGFNAKPQDPSSVPQRSSRKTETSVETVLYKQVGPTALFADIYFPSETKPEPLPIALMIHGGGHVMLSRKDIRPKQTAYLHSLDFLPISIDYRLCPEVALPDGPMTDAVDALDWVRRHLRNFSLLCPGLNVDYSRVVVVGWSTGGHLAMTTAFTSVPRGISPPDAILAFYCPTDYEDPCWSRPNYPESSTALAHQQSDADSYDPRESINQTPITAYNVPASAGAAVGGWSAPSDPRSRLVYHMNWRGQCLPVLLNGLSPATSGDDRPAKQVLLQEQPDNQRIREVSPYAQIVEGNYRVPTCIVHGDEDDLIPWEQSVRVGDALRDRGVRSQVQIVKGKKHLFDLFRDTDGTNWEALERAYGFLRDQVIAAARD